MLMSTAAPKPQRQLRIALSNRLQKLALQLCPCSPLSAVATVAVAATTATTTWMLSQSHVSIPAGSSPRPRSCLPRLLQQDDDGIVVAEDFAELERLELSAAAVRDYHQAALMRYAIDALTPAQAAPTPQSCAPTGVDAQEAFFLENGFIVVDNVLGPEQLARAQAAWASVQPRAQAKWEAQGRPEGYFDIPSLLELDDAFIDMVDSPALVPLMARVTGFEDALNTRNPISVGGATGCTRVGKMSGRVVPSHADSSSYTWWHNDVSLCRLLLSISYGCDRMRSLS